MCGIVGLFAKRPSLQANLGRYLARMLVAMRDRGPDSAGFAVFGHEDEGVKLTLRGPSGYDFRRLGQSLHSAIDVRDTHAVLHVTLEHRASIIDELHTLASCVEIVGQGRRMEIYKEVGRPEDVADRFGLAQMQGTHAIGHTRMATESAVTIKGAHPYSTGADQCLVHNGSLSNHNGLRRTLVREGFVFETENDTEVAAAYLSWRMRQGLSLESALQAGLADLDGFYTFVVGTRTGFAVLRDPVCCKPAVMAETADWVAFGSEYRALADLPGIDEARVWEPEPAHVYAWDHAA